MTLQFGSGDLFLPLITSLSTVFAALLIYALLWQQKRRERSLAPAPVTSE